MKTLIRTMIVFAAVNLIAIVSVFAGNVDGKETSDVIVAQLKPAETSQQQEVLTTREGLLSNYSITNRFLGSRSGNTGAVLVIPSAEISAEEIATITEDMNIMSRIFDKNLQHAHIHVSSMLSFSSDPFHRVFFGRGRQTTQVMYLQGYGALFMMKVDFPLSPPPQVEEEQKETRKEEDADEVWAEIRQEMFEPEESRKNKNDRPKKIYDAEKVNDLRTTIIRSLKHAANIRSLKPDEWIILTITGSGTPSGYKSVTSIPGGNQVVVVDQNNRTRVLRSDQIGDLELSLPTVLVIRAKKSDIDNFAKGDLDFDQFQQNTQILTSTYLADQSGSGNPLIDYYRGYTINRR